MAVFSNTELSATIDEKWAMDVEDARYAASVIMPRILNKSEVVANHGDIVNIQYKTKYTVGSVTSATGAFVPQSYTVTSVAVTVDQWQQVAVEILDRAKAQSFYSPDSDFGTDAGSAFGEDIDGAVAALHPNITSNVIGDQGNPSAFDDIPMLAGMLKLADRNIPKKELSFILPPIAFYLGLFTKDRFTDADKAGLPKNVLSTNFRFPLLGVPAYESTLLKTPAGTTAIKGLLIHKSCLAVAVQKNTEIKTAERTASLVFSYVAAAQALYGVKTFREDHGVVINIKNS